MALSEEEVAAFEEYFYHITAARGSGEHALRHILKPFAWAHNPLEPQLQHLKVCLFADQLTKIMSQRWCHTDDVTQIMSQRHI